MPESDGKRGDLRPAVPRDAIEIANELREEVVRVEFPDDQLQECASPLKLRRACGKESKRTWTKLLPPPLDVELLLGSSGVFEESIDVDRKIVDLAHAQTSGIATRATSARVSKCRGPGPPAVRVWVRHRAGMCPRGYERGSVDRREEATCGAIECEPSVLPGGALTETCQSLHVAPYGTGIRLELLRECVRLAGLLLRQIESLNGRLEHRIARRPELLGGCAQELRAIVGGIGVECCADVVQRRRPRILNRRTHVPAPEASNVLKSPNQMVSTDHPKQEHVERKGGGTDITVPENESAEQTGVRAVRGIVEIAIAVHEEQKHVSVSQVGAGRNLLGAELAVLVSER